MIVGGTGAILGVAGIHSRQEKPCDSFPLARLARASRRTLQATSLSRLARPVNAINFDTVASTPRRFHSFYRVLAAPIVPNQLRTFAREGSRYQHDLHAQDS
jgi:hypothetical protein